MFADDANIFRWLNDPDQAQLLQNDLNALKNDEKCSYVS